MMGFDIGTTFLAMAALVVLRFALIAAAVILVCLLAFWVGYFIPTILGF
jgi:hypothetical protein